MYKRQIFSNAHGEEVARVITEFDGYFIADGLIAGDYRVNVDPSVHEKLGTLAIADLEFTADSDSGVTYLDTIYLSADIDDLASEEEATTSELPIAQDDAPKAFPADLVEPSVTVNPITDDKVIDSNLSHADGDAQLNEGALIVEDLVTAESSSSTVSDIVIEQTIKGKQALTDSKANEIQASSITTNRIDDAQDQQDANTTADSTDTANTANTNRLTFLRWSIGLLLILLLLLAGLIIRSRWRGS